MRKNNGNRTNLNKLFYSRFKVEGLNLDRLIYRLNKSGINLFNLKKRDRRIIFSVRGDDDKKVFAISNELCYNITKLGKHGKLYPVYTLLKNFGVLLGAIVFTAICVYSSDLCFAVDFYGNGNAYEREVSEYLAKNGVKPFARFSTFDLETLEDRILADSDRFSFVSCEKKGNRLKIELVLKEDNEGISNGNVPQLYSDVDGIVESVTVYRGTAEVKVGDTVKKGDILVDGYALIKEEKIPINVLAVVTLKTFIEKVVILSGEGQEELATLIASAELGDKEILSAKTTCEKEENGYKYTVRIGVKHVLVAG